MRARTSLTVVVAVTLLLCACPAQPGGADGGDGGAVSTGDGGTVVSADGGVSYAPVLTSVTAQVSGRTGRDLRFAIKGKDRDLDVTGLWVRLLDAQGGPVAGVVDLNHDGVPDGNEAAVLLGTQKYLGESLTADATLRQLFEKGLQVAQVGVALIDATNQRSSELVVSVAAQPIRSLGEPCDGTFIADRCSAGLGCRGAPLTCQEGAAPQVTRFAYYRSNSGAFTLIEGTEPEDDLANLHLEFQNAQGQPVSADSDGDGTPDLASVDFTAVDLAVDGVFFVSLPQSVGVAQTIAKMVVTPSDVAGHQGATKVAALSDRPTRLSGQTCDARGFDVCGPSLVCQPGVLGVANKCEAASTQRTAQCKAAPVLIPTVGGSSVLASAQGGSLWDAPEGCSSANPTGRPEGLVVVRLTERAARLTLSTARPGTTFDTTLYVLLGCPADSADNFGCSDDKPGSSGSELVLNDLPAGDYLAVVDSFDGAGGTFELFAKLE
jgi:hypothetical protein